MNSEHCDSCSICGAPLASDDQLQSVAVASSEPEWRLEVAKKLEAYRARRGQRGRAPAVVREFSRAPGAGMRRNSQQPLPFQIEPRPPDLGHASNATATRAMHAGGLERMEISAYQPALDFSGGDAGPQPESTMAVAPLGLRTRAGLLDAGFLLVTYAGFAGLFAALGGHFSFQNLDAAIYAAAFLLFYAQYFVLFTAFGGSTPGMQLCRLSVMSFDGNPVTNRQLLWRSFGYVVAGGAAMLGFLWSLWDEQHLTWQDRISQTYITEIPQQGESEGSAATIRW